MRSARQRLVSLLSAVLWTACAGAGAPEPEPAPDPIRIDGWRRADIHGLIVYTDASDAAVRRALRHLSRFVDVVSQVVYGHPFRARRRLEVFVFGAREEYLRFAPEFVAGHASRGEEEIATALSIEQAFESRETLYHELVHVVLHNDPERNFPSWFHEGLATFFGTSVQRGDVLTVGGPSPRAVQELRHKRPLPLRRLLSSPAYAQPDVGLFYADAWAFVHFGLLSGSLGGRDHREEFGRFVSRVSRGAAWEPAFLAGFGADPKAVGEEFREHRRRLAEMQVPTLSNFPLDMEAPALEFVPVDRFEIARELAQLGLSGLPTGAESAAQLFDLLLQAEPHDREAAYGAIRVAAMRDELERGQALWERLPEDGRQGREAWQAEADLALAQATGGGSARNSEVRAAHLSRALDRYRRVLELAPQRLSALVGLGRALVLAEAEDPADGIAVLERAVEMSPESPAIRLDLAELLIRREAGSEARPHLNYVIEAYPNTPYARRAQALRRQLPSD